MTCPPERVKHDTVKALAHAYIVNTNQLGMCNKRIEGLVEFYKAQGEIYNAGNK